MPFPSSILHRISQWPQVGNPLGFQVCHKGRPSWSNQRFDQDAEGWRTVVSWKTLKFLGENLPEDIVFITFYFDIKNKYDT